MNIEFNLKRVNKSKWFLKIKSNAELIVHHEDNIKLIGYLVTAVDKIDFKKEAFLRDELLVIDTLMYIKSYHIDVFNLYAGLLAASQPSAASQPRGLTTPAETAA